MGKLRTAIDRAYMEAEVSQWSAAEERQRGKKRWSGTPAPNEHRRPTKVPKYPTRTEVSNKQPENPKSGKREKVIQDRVRFARNA